MACARPPPPAAPAGTWTRVLERSTTPRPDGADCAWEVEQVLFEGLPLVVGALPADDAPCEAPGEGARTVDVGTQRGPFLPLKIIDTGCCAATAAARCFTIDLRTGRPAPAEALAPKEATALRDAAHARAAEGWSVEADGFVLGEAGPVWCAARGGELVELPSPPAAAPVR